MEDKKIFWTEAMTAGLVLGGVSSAYLLIQWLISLLPSAKVVQVIASVAGIFLWIFKFWACIHLMKVLLKNHSANNPEAVNADVFRFGVAAAFLSAIIYSAAYLAYMVFLAPDVISTFVDMMKESPMLDSNSLAMIDAMVPKMPTICFFVNLIYCTLFGTVVAAIQSRNIPSANPFSNK